ncbi:MAG: sigma 54-interacting transcriptional regulator [Thermodesulfobacteriota bacterium]
MSRILVVDDDLSMREFLDLMLAREGYEVRLAAGGREALDLAETDPYDLVITDIRMKHVDGIEVLKGIKARRPETVVILISAFATVEAAVTAMKEGAYDFIPKPFNVDELKAVVRDALMHRTPENERRVLKEKVKEGCHFGSLVGLSPPMLKVYDLIRRAAQTPTNILVSGESGTGKELVARAIHENSPRAEEKFVAINCGGMPEQLIESELFGYRKGAFTGAAMDKPGLFELAHKGTIFLDEIGELSLAMQVKLLRVVQDKTYRPLGDTRERVLDLRLIAATNKNLEAEVIAGRFREDLYYRLNVINIHLPPLRERKEDIPILAQFFLDKYTRVMNKDVRKISAFALDILAKYHFPGNVRELENIIERSVALEQSSIILPESLTLASFKTERRLEAAAPPEQDHPAPPAGPEKAEPGLDQVLWEVERGYLLQALFTSAGVRQRAAELLGLSTWRLRSRLKAQGVDDLGPREIQDLIRTDRTAGLPDHLAPSWTEEGLDLDLVLLRIEKYLIERAVTRAGGSKTKAAELLGLSPRALHGRLARTRKLEGR